MGGGVDGVVSSGGVVVCDVDVGGLVGCEVDGCEAGDGAVAGIECPVDFFVEFAGVVDGEAGEGVEVVCVGLEVEEVDVSLWWWCGDGEVEVLCYGERFSGGVEGGGVVSFCAVVDVDVDDLCFSWVEGDGFLCGDLCFSCVECPVDVFCDFAGVVDGEGDECF